MNVETNTTIKGISVVYYGMNDKAICHVWKNKEVFVLTRIILDLLDNTIHGRWSAQLGNLIAFKMSKSTLNNDIPLAHGMGLYFLFSDNAIYVGISEDVQKKIQTGHSYAGWKTAVLILSQNDSLTEKHINYLWAELCKHALQGKYKVVNDYIPAQPILPISERDNLETILHMIGVLLYTFGYVLFDTNVKEKQTPLLPSVDLFYIKKKGGADAKGCWEDGTITVLKGSMIRPELTGSAGSSIREKRNELIGSGVIKDFKFTCNHQFTTPSGAAAVILGCNSDGWTEWKNKDGKTLKSLKR